jgi:uncharacterized SAM-binding protein YcdF (DUF218 family)
MQLDRKLSAYPISPESGMTVSDETGLMSNERIVGGGGTGPRPGRGRGLWRVVLLALSLLVVALGFGLIADFTRFVLALEDREPLAVPSADGIVALTGGAERISDAISLLAEGRARRLLITGVNQSTSDVALSAAAPERRDLLACCIDLDRNALNTVGNALEAARWVGANHFRSIIVVTSNYHMPRSLMELRRVLPETEIIAYPVTAPGVRLDRWWQDASTIRVLLYEYAKYTGALLRLRIDPPTARTEQAAL